MNEKLNTFPYFYIIEHIRTKKLYCGSQYSKKCNPKKLLSTEKNTYTTSSKIINEIIDIEGIDIFTIRKIKVFNTGDKTYNYETRFLQKLDCANNPKFYNKHNNNGSNSAVHFTNKNLKWFNNNERSCMFLLEEVPNGWILGRLSLKSKGKKYYTDGKDSKMFFKNEQPEGWVLGNTSSKGENNCQYGKPSFNNNLKGYHKDNKIAYFREGYQPEGWVLGQTNSFKENRSKVTSGKNNPRYGERGRKFYNNGVSCKLFIPGTEIEGFKLGLLRGGNAQIK